MRARVAPPAAPNDNWSGTLNNSQASTVTERGFETPFGAHSEILQPFLREYRAPPLVAQELVQSLIPEVRPVIALPVKVPAMSGPGSIRSS